MSVPVTLSQQTQTITRTNSGFKGFISQYSYVFIRIYWILKCINQSLIPLISSTSTKRGCFSIKKRTLLSTTLWSCFDAIYIV